MIPFRRCDERPSETQPAASRDPTASRNVASVTSVSGFVHAGTHRKAIAAAPHGTAHHARPSVSQRDASLTGMATARLDKASAEGQAGQVRALAATGLVPDPVQVRADRADADVQRSGDLHVGVAVRDQGNQLPFPGTKVAQGR